MPLNPYPSSSAGRMSKLATEAPAPDSLRAKLLLLVVDKLVIGALIALAFVVYDQWKTRETDRYQEAQRERDFDFKRAEYVRDLVPLVLAPSNDIRLRGQAFAALVNTRSIDPISTVQLAQELLMSDILSADLQPVQLPLGAAADTDTVYVHTSAQFDFLTQTLLKVMPQALLPALDKFEYADTKYRSLTVNSRNTTPQAGAHTWATAASFWIHLLHDDADRYVDSLASPFDPDSILLRRFDVVARMMSENSLDDSQRWARSRTRALRLLGSLHRLYWTHDTLAAAYIVSVIDPKPSESSLRLAYLTLLSLDDTKQVAWPPRQVYPQIARSLLTIVLRGPHSSIVASSDTDTQLAWRQRFYGAGAYLDRLSTYPGIEATLEPQIIVALRGYSATLRRADEKDLRWGGDLYPTQRILVAALVAADTTRGISASHAAESLLADLFAVVPDKLLRVGIADEAASWLAWRTRDHH